MQWGPSTESRKGMTNCITVFILVTCTKENLIPPSADGGDLKPFVLWRRKTRTCTVTRRKLGYDS